MKKLFLLMLSVFAFCVADAQVTTSGMNGTVTDADGQPLAGATVIAVHTPSGTQYGAVTDKNGGYNLQGLRTGGPYTVTFSFVGCQSVEFPGLMLSLGQTLKRDAFLKDSQELEAVVITADGKNSSMNVNRAGAVTSISNEQIELMPTVNRSMNDIMRLTPQASSTTSGLAIGGGNYRQSYVTVDGAAFNNMFGIGGNLPAGGSPISLDALEQVSVSITPFDVRQSGFTGGAINAVTKSGTNDLKVSAYLYSKSDQLQGDKYDGGKLSLSEMRNNTLGFSVGAPIVRNKLFVFANFEREWNTTPGNSRLARTSESQDFGKALQYNRPTTAKLDEMSRFLIDNYGYNPGAYQNYSVKTPGYKLMARVDWNINRNHALNVRFSRTQNKYSSAPSSSISPLNAGKVYDKDVYGRTSVYAMYFGNSRYYQEQNFTSVAAELNSRFMDSRLTNTLRYTYSHQYEPRNYDGGIFRRERPVRLVRTRSLHRRQPARSVDAHPNRRDRLHAGQAPAGGRFAVRAQPDHERLLAGRRGILRLRELGRLQERQGPAGVPHRTRQQRRIVAGVPPVLPHAVLGLPAGRDQRKRSFQGDGRSAFRGSGLSVDLGQRK